MDDRPRRRSPDDGLSPDNDRQLNSLFYSADPAVYFEQRWLNAVLVGGKQPELDRLFDEGASIGKLEVGPLIPTTPERKQAAQNFVALEAEVLAHHVSESLLRLYLAHAYSLPEERPSCPWLEIARVRDFRRFKEIVNETFGEGWKEGDQWRRRAIPLVFYGVDAPTRLNPAPTEAVWEDAITFVEGYLRGFAGLFLDRAALYNAAKHGLAMAPGESSLKMDDGALIDQKGPSIAFLDIERAGIGGPRWRQVHHWVQSDRQLALTRRAIQLIDRLWTIARARYTPKRAKSPVKVQLMTAPSYAEVYISGQAGVGLETMSMDLLYDDELGLDEDESSDR